MRIINRNVYTLNGREETREREREGKEERANVHSDD